MIIHTDIESFIATNPVITIGTFDGVHLGHRKVINQLNEIAQSIHGESVLFTFHPHPRLVVSTDTSDLRLITTRDEKIAQLDKTGIDHLVIFPFTKEFASLSYEKFIQTILIDKLKMHTLVVGYDHRFGKNREGSFENIIKLSKKYHFEIEKINTFLVNGIAISSSKIRQALNNGEIKKANTYLGYPFSIKGTIVPGKQIGRKMGFPTANIKVDEAYKLIPGNGVYAVTIMIGEEIHPAMLNIGYRPTVNDHAEERSIEAHIFDFDHNIYQQKASLFFHQFIRNEHKFDGIKELTIQLKDDQKQAQQALSSII